MQQLTGRRLALIAVGLVAVTALLAWWTQAESNFAAIKNPFAGARLVQNDPTLPAAQYAKDHPDAAWAQQLAAVPRAHWLADDQSANDLPNWLKIVDGQRALPVLVIYRIPNRDCGSYSRDSAPLTNGQYDAWISRVVHSLGRRQAAIIYEPDALVSKCYTDNRGDIMHREVRKLANAGYTVYLDAGNSHRDPTIQELKRRLLRAGVDQAEGFSLNVSSFFSIQDEQRFGDALSKMLKGRHYVIDTSRNGSGPPQDTQSANWFCNPVDIRLGQNPTTRTSDSRADAYLWIKNPDISDGQCRRGDPPTGQFYPAQAQRLVEQR